MIQASGLSEKVRMTLLTNRLPIKCSRSERGLCPRNRILGGGSEGGIDSVLVSRRPRAAAQLELRPPPSILAVGELRGGADLDEIVLEAPEVAVRDEVRHHDAHEAGLLPHDEG